jgi:predicted amidophosphoribosyltransferase
MDSSLECPKCWGPLEPSGDLLWCKRCKEEFVTQGQFVVPYLGVPTEVEYAEY